MIKRKSQFLSFSIRLRVSVFTNLKYQDAIREGDGIRVLDCWNYLMILFKGTGRTNYALEAFITLANCKWILPDRQMMQVKYSRFINTRGLPGCNIPCDLYMEHLNRIVKSCIHHLGANKIEKTIQHVGKIISPIDDILSAYDEENDVTLPSIHHSPPPLIKDRDCIIRALVEYEVFSTIPGCAHKDFEKFT